MRRWHSPGWIRAAWVTPLGAALALGLIVGLRALLGYEPLFKTSPSVTVVLIIAPLSFLVGIGCFDYWLRWAIGAPTVPEDHSSHGARTWRDYFRVNTDHKVIGVQYIVTTMFFMVIGGALAELIRVELAQPGQQLVDPSTFNSLTSVHGTVMIFMVVVPILAGIANYVLPLMIGAPDMAFPRLNALSYWMLLAGGMVILAGFLAPGGNFNTGWTAYAPLSDQAPLGQQFFIVGVQILGTSSLMSAINFVVTIITMRAPGMTFWRMPLFVWSNFATSLLVVIATPFVAGALFLVMMDRTLGANFFQAAAGGEVLSYQHIFWFYSHPAVYIMVLPGFGIISEVIAANSRKPVFGYRMMALSIMAIVFLGLVVWAHHMFVSGMWSWLRIPMMITTALIAIPTGVKIFSWLATLWRGVLRMSTPMLFALAFLTMFTLGGISGVFNAAVPVDIHNSDTYFIVAHLHYVLFGGSMFTIFAGLYYWFPKITGRMYDETLGKVHFWLTLVGLNVTFGPMHLLGLGGMPRRVADYAEKFGDLNLVSSLGAFVLGISMLVFFYNMVVSCAWGPRAVRNPWGAHTLEWQVPTPVPVFNFDRIPQVVGGPYGYGVPGAVHGILNGSRAKTPAGDEGDRALVGKGDTSSQAGSEESDYPERRE